MTTRNVTDEARKRWLERDRKPAMGWPLKVNDNREDGTKKAPASLRGEGEEGRGYIMAP